MNKPPLGLTPEHIFNTMQNTERIAEIIAAMKRYSEYQYVEHDKW